MQIRQEEHTLRYSNVERQVRHISKEQPHLILCTSIGSFQRINGFMLIDRYPITRKAMNFDYFSIR
jgi:hypothetical protein